MFFVISKTLGIMLLPTQFPDRAGLIGAILLATRFAASRPQADGRLAGAACGLRLVAARKPVALSAGAAISAVGRQQAARPTASSCSARRSMPTFRLAHGTAVVRGAPDRIMAAAMLAHRYPNARIVLYRRQRQFDLQRCARKPTIAAEIFEGLGIAKSRLMMERNSRNTLENAEFSKTMVNPKPGERWLMVTSAFHMPRSVGLFRKAGFAVEPYPVDWSSGRAAAIFDLFQHRGRRPGADRSRGARMDGADRLPAHRQDRCSCCRAHPK